MFHKNKKSGLKKSLGQNFLRDEEVLDRIIEQSSIGEGGFVIEVGPGDGALTEKLLETGAHVIALEIDQDLIPGLHERFKGRENFTLLNEDIRRFNLPEYLEQQSIKAYDVIANLPYYITSSIIRFFLESSHQPEEMILMVQKEVGERICAAEGGASKLSVSVQYYGQPEYLFTVPATAFEPVPQVDSCIIGVKSITRSQSQDAEKQFFRTVRAGFAARRKTLVNNLSNSLHIDKKEAGELLESSGIPLTARAQELSIDAWKKLALRVTHL